MKELRSFILHSISNELDSYLWKDIHILEFKESPGSMENDNFLGELHAVEAKVQVRDSVKSFHFMIKTIAPSKEDFTKKIFAFEKEANMYNLVIPSIKEMGDGIGISAPKCFYASETSKVIVMENMKLQGFALLPAKFGMEMQHIQWVLDELARLHAYSHVLLKGKEREKILQSLKLQETVDFSDPSSQFSSIYKAQVKALKAVGRKDLGKRLQTAIPKAGSALTSILSNNNSKFPVLNHGDGWTNNFMFKHDNQGNIFSGIIMDWQFVNHGSPATDLAIFFGSSIAPKKREVLKVELLLNYYERLSFHTKTLGLDITELYPFKTLCEEYVTRFPQLYFIAAQMLPIFYMKKEYDKANDESRKSTKQTWEESVLTLAKKDSGFRQCMIDFHEVAASKNYI